MRSHLITHQLIFSSQSAKISFFYDVFMKFKILKQLYVLVTSLCGLNLGQPRFQGLFPGLGKAPGNEVESGPIWTKNASEVSC